MHSIGEHVWIQRERSESFNVPKGCKIMKIEKKRVQVQDDDGHIQWIISDRIIKPLHASQIAMVDDMIRLGDLQEYAILRNLRLRYKKQIIYTYIGDMLIAVNPYQVLNIYSAKEVSMYSEGNELPPHIYATSNKCFQAMRYFQQSQCILISGESGAGKTESTKLILQYLTAVSAGGHSWIKQQILETNPILEAFGNAKTEMNDNSSRFGKCVKIYFNDNQEIEGAQIDCYLLEKSRIVTHAKAERTYHIFYSLFAGLSETEKNRLHLKNISDFKYLQGVIECKDRNDAKTFADLKTGMKILNYDDETFLQIIHLLSAILHLGNLKYEAIISEHTDATTIHDDISLQKVCEFFGLSTETFTDFLTKKCIIARGEKVMSNLLVHQAQEVRDSLAKVVYEKIFTKLLDGINNMICSTRKYWKKNINILDISGFENFSTNSFEQLCINYANERLQQFFVWHIFKMEQENYASEGITWRSINFTDNKDIIELIGMKPLNIMSLVDEESIFPKGSDGSLLTKISLIHANNENFVKVKSHSVKGFGIAHYAGNVQYDVTGFLDKNRDHFSGDIEQLVIASSNDFFKKLFSKNDLPHNGNLNKKSTTLSTKFRESLESLLNTLGKCNPFFIRCVKPNEHQVCQIFDEAFCYRQLRYLGLLDTAKIRQAGYPHRYDYSEFVERFGALARGIEPSQRFNKKFVTERICINILSPNKHDYQLGHSKIFLKNNENLVLEENTKRVLNINALILQTNLKMWVYRKRFMKKKNSAIIIQKIWKGYKQRKLYLLLHNGIARLQSRIRSRYQVFDFQKKRKIIIAFQSLCRRYLVQKYCKEKREQLRINKYEQVNKYVTCSNTNLERNSIDTAFDFLDNESIKIKTRKISNEIHVDLARKDSPDGTPSEISDGDITSYDFHEYAAIYFTPDINSYFSKQPLKHSLLDLPHISDQLAAKALSITILRFMGDMPEPENRNIEHHTQPIMSDIMESLSKNFMKTSKFNELANQHFLRLTLRKKNKLNKVITHGIISDEYEPWLNSKRSNTEKLHFIIGHGILRNELKDEIYCQIVRQLIHNPSKSSYAKGWVLLSLCIGCFSPTDKFINYLKSFIKSGPPDYAPLCAKRLIRTYENGSRLQPPCWIEIQSVKNRQPIPLKISFANGSSKIIQADSASTSQEIVKSLANSINLKDIFGFSLFVAIDNKVSSLGSEKEHMMDAISQCEQYSVEQGSSERDQRWRLMFRKEIFAPWHDLVDQVATNLIYHQICNCIKLGEYRFNNENDLATFIAQQLFVNYHYKSLPKNLKNTIHTYVPNQLLLKDSNYVIARLEKLVINVYEKKFGTSSCNPINIKEEVVMYAKNSWPMLFSKFYEVNKIFGPIFNVAEVVLAVNSTGIFFIDNDEQILLRISFPEVSEVDYQKIENNILHNLTLSTIHRKEFRFQSYNAENFALLVHYLIDGLKQRSTYVVAIQDYVNNDNNDLKVSLKRGDLIKLINGCRGSTVATSTWATGELNNISIKFPCEYVYVLPILSKPSTILTKVFKSDFLSKTENSLIQELNCNIKEMKYHNLKKFSYEYFHGSKNKLNNRAWISTMNNLSHELWKHSREPATAPLLAVLADDSEKSKQAVRIFKFILRYMGDLPSSQQRICTDFTDQIFGPALKDDLLSDEVYCQIMRQLTLNRVRLSEERGWELMWLATGIMSCSLLVRKELEQFLASRNNNATQACLRRLEMIEKTGLKRVHPPYVLEVEAIKFKNLKIFHKIYFPDGTDSAFEVHSSIRALDLCDEISKIFQLRESKSFSLTIKVANRFISVPRHYFFFDFLREIVDLQNHVISKTTYQIFFTKKIWINCPPGYDKNADLKFHYYQEAKKYLYGYCKCMEKDAVELASLIYISSHANNKEELDEIHLKLHEYVPKDMINLRSPKKWKKQIIQACNQNKDLSQAEAKMRFLQIVYRWSSFGSSFFEVHQTTDSKLPQRLFIAINKNGVSLIEPTRKNLITLFSYPEISNWSSGDTFFHLTIGNFLSGRKILCETDLGYEMDDLIKSYIEYLQTESI